MAKFVCNGLAFHYEVIGEGEPFVFLHGLGGDINQPINTFKPIPGVQLIVFDQRAHGKTGIMNWDTMDFNQLADDLFELTQFLGIEKFYLAGISMGAAVATNFAIRYQDHLKGLILIRIAWLAQPMSDRVRQWFETTASYLAQRNGLTSFEEDDVYLLMKQDYPEATNSFLRLFQDRVAKKYPQKFIIMPRLQPLERMEDLELIKVPTLIVSNKQDPVHPFEYGAAYEKYIPNVTSVEITSKVIDESKHLEELNNHIKTFLKK